MIYLYSGTPGSGKSLHIARMIYNSLGAGYACICNFQIDLNKIHRNNGKFCYMDNEELTPSFLRAYSDSYFSELNLTVRKKEGRLRLFIDEAQLLFNARDWGQKGRNDWLSFFTQHRHLGYDIFLVAQFDRMLDRQIRSLIEYEYIHRKVNNFGKAGKILGILTLGQLFCCVKVWYPMKEKVGSEFFKCHKKYYSLYDTHIIFGQELQKPAPPETDATQDGDMGTPPSSGRPEGVAYT